MTKLTDATARTDILNRLRRSPDSARQHRDSRAHRFKERIAEPLGLGRQGQGPNHQKLRRPNGRGGERLRKRRNQSVRYALGRRT